MKDMKNIFIKSIALFTAINIGYVNYALPQSMWTKTYGRNYADDAFFVQQTSDKGYIIVGWTESYNSGSYDTDAWLIKTNTYGDTLWTKTFGGSEIDYAWSVQQTTDEGYIIAGETRSFGCGSFDVWLIKTDTLGDTVWTKTYGGIDGDGASYVRQTLDGGYIISAWTNSFSVGNLDIWLIKTDSKGDTLWTKTFGGSGIDEASSVQQTLDEGYIIAGGTESFSSGSFDVWLIKTNTSGDTLWTKTHGGVSAEGAAAVQQTIDGGYIIAGATHSFGLGFTDIWLIKTNSFGDTVWTKTFGGWNYDGAWSVQQTLDGGYIIAGATASFGAGSDDVWLIKTNSFGDTLWTTTYGGIGGDRASCVQQTMDGGYIVVGVTSSFGSGSSDIWLIKTDGMGNTVTNMNIANLEIPCNYKLFQNYPNPFNSITSIKYEIQVLGRVQIDIYDISGKLVKQLFNENCQPGLYNITWDGSDQQNKLVATGIFYLRFTAKDYQSVRQMLLLK